MLKRNAKSKILSLCIFAAMLLFVIGILYFGYLMVMRAQWKGLKNDIADAINAASRSNPTFSIGDEALPFDAQDEFYFSKFISDPYLLPMKSGCMERSARSIVISLNGSELVFTPGEDDSIINIRLDSPDGSKGFYARSPVGFDYLERYFLMRSKYAES